MRLSLRLCGAFMLAACGSGGPHADEPEALEGDEVAEEVILEDGQVLIGALSAEPAPDAQPRPAPEVARRGPADRAPAGSRSNEPALAEAERLHALALSTPLDETEPSETVQDAVAALDARFEAATRATDAALEAYAALAEEAQLAPIANTRAGDLLDAMAARFAAPPARRPSRTDRARLCRRARGGPRRVLRAGSRAPDESGRALVLSRRPALPSGQLRPRR